MGHYHTLPDGCRLFYRTLGPPGAPWIVLLNGVLSETTHWNAILSGLTGRFRVLTYDGRGQGRSDAPDHPYTMEQKVGDAMELMRMVERPWLVGLSNGAALALNLLSRYPDHWAGGILVSPAPPMDYSLRLKLLHWLDCFEKGGSLMQFEAAAPYVWGDRFLAGRYEFMRSGHLRPGRSETGARNQLLGSLSIYDPPDPARIAVPVLVLSGAKDLLTPPWKALEVAKSIPACRFEVIPDVGHVYPIEDPKAFVARLLLFVNKNDGSTETIDVESTSKP